MSRARHKNRAEGGKVTAYAGGESNVMKEAQERKHGGRVHKGHQEGEGEHSKQRVDKRARGGKVKHHHAHGIGHHKHEGHPAHHSDGGEAHHKSMHKAPGRKRGGGVGADKHPLTSAAKIKEVTKGELAEDTPKND